MEGTSKALDPGDRVANKTGHSACPREAHAPVERPQAHKQTKYMMSDDGSALKKKSRGGAQRGSGLEERDGFSLYGVIKKVTAKERGQVGKEASGVNS